MSLQDPKSTAAMIRKIQKKSKYQLQFAALVYRMRNHKPQVLLITSRGSQQWLIPKGWPIDGLKPHQAAAQEAWEEAGVLGRVQKQPLGLYCYRKQSRAKPDMPLQVMVFAMMAKHLVAEYPERLQRRRKWLSPKKAAARIANPELAQLVRGFDPVATSSRAA